MDLNENIVRKLKLSCKKFPTVRKLTLFGSRARGDNTPFSDIDLCVEVEEAIIPHDLRENFEVDAGLLTVDLVDMKWIDNDLLLKLIEREGVVIYERTE